MKHIILAVALVVLGSGVCFSGGGKPDPDRSWRQKLRTSDNHKPETDLKVLGEKRHTETKHMEKTNNKVLDKKGKARQPQKGRQEKPRQDTPRQNTPRHDSPRQNSSHGRDVSPRPPS
jgi:hypothetical protein